MTTRRSSLAAVPAMSLHTKDAIRQLLHSSASLPTSVPAVGSTSLRQRSPTSLVASTPMPRYDGDAELPRIRTRAPRSSAAPAPSPASHRASVLVRRADAEDFHVVEELSAELEVLTAHAAKFETALRDIPALRADLDASRAEASASRRRVEELERDLRRESGLRIEAERQLAAIEAKWRVAQETEARAQATNDAQLTTLLGSARSASDIQVQTEALVLSAQSEVAELRRRLFEEEAQRRIAVKSTEVVERELDAAARSNAAEREAAALELAEFLPDAEMLAVELATARVDGERARAAAQRALLRQEAAAALDADVARSELSHAESTCAALLSRSAAQHHALRLELERTHASNEAERAALGEELLSAAAAFEGLLVGAVSERDALEAELRSNVSVLLFTVTFHANLAHSLTRSP